MLNIGNLDRYIPEEKIQEIKKEILFKIMSDKDFVKLHSFRKEIKSKDNLLPQKISFAIYLNVMPSRQRKSGQIKENQIFKDIAGFRL